MNRLEFYLKLLTKLKMIKSGILELDHYILEVESKISALSEPVGIVSKCKTCQRDLNSLDYTCPNTACPTIGFPKT